MYSKVVDLVTYQRYGRSGLVSAIDSVNCGADALAIMYWSVAVASALPGNPWLNVERIGVATCRVSYRLATEYYRAAVDVHKVKRCRKCGLGLTGTT